MYSHTVARSDDYSKVLNNGLATTSSGRQLLQVKTFLELNSFEVKLVIIILPRLNMHSVWFKSAISTHLLNASYYVIGFCIQTLIHSVSTLQHSKRTKNCTMHLPLLELEPSRPRSKACAFTTTLRRPGS